MRIGYARTSALDQAPDLQIEALLGAGCKKIVTERASGARADRPELKRALNEMLREGDTLVVWRLDQLARSLKQLIDTATRLRTRRVGLVSLTDAIDTDLPGGMLFFHILEAIAEFEQASIRERTLAGLAEAKRQGKHGGRPRQMSEKDAAAARVLLASGQFSAKEVAARFSVSRATLYRHVAKAKP